MREAGAVHGTAWVIWLLATATALATTRNPIYIGLFLLWIAGVVWMTGLTRVQADVRMTPISIPRFGLFVVLFSGLFNGVSVHVGRTVLFGIPEQIPLLGGPVTGEAITYGVLNGLVLTGLFAAFSVLNRTLSMRTLIRLVPRAYYPLAVVMSISLTFVPSTLRAMREIGEAQAIRGHAVRGVRGWLPLLLPLLVNGLERALQLAEAMTARGFAGEPDTAQDRVTQALAMGGLVSFVTGLLLYLVWNQTVAGVGTGALGVIGLVLAARRAGRRHVRTVYRPTPWQFHDWLVAGAATATLLLFVLPLPGIDRSSIFYNPYPALSAPGFSLLLGVATWGTLMPIFVLAMSSGRVGSRRTT